MCNGLFNNLQLQQLNCRQVQIHRKITTKYHCRSPTNTEANAISLHISVTKELVLDRYNIRETICPGPEWLCFALPVSIGTQVLLLSPVTPTLF